jgi:hypothetical protein
MNTVPKEGLEPSHPKAQEPKSCVSTSSTTPAHDSLITDLSESQHQIWCSDSDKSAVFDWFGVRSGSLQMKISLELVDVTGGLDVVLSDRDRAVALLVHIDDEGRADHPLDELAVERRLIRV